MKNVDALEADDYAKLPGPVFIQGYLRNMPGCLGAGGTGFECLSRSKPGEFQGARN